VAFEIPERGVRMDFEKAFVKEGEANSVTVKYKKKIEITPETRRLIWVAAVVIVICFLFWLLLLVRRRRLRPGSAPISSGPTKEVSP
jgi:hypothetical protein